MSSERFVTSTLNKKDTAQDSTLRPQRFGDFPGQGKVKERLELYVQAAKERRITSYNVCYTKLLRTLRNALKKYIKEHY